MAKLALLIGVNNYGSGLTPLKAPLKDINALAEILNQPEIGAFDRVERLPDPTPQEMEEKIRDFFQSSRKEDLVLLYFSGHGILDRSGSKFFLGTRSACFSSKDELYQTTVISTELIYELIDFCPCQQQIIILDCCHSGAFGDNLITNNGNNLNIKQSLEKGGKRGRVILASCIPHQLSYEQKDRELSLYTHHLVTGLETGDADIDLDGQITVEDLHYYVQKQIQAETKMRPEMLSLQLEAGKIVMVETTSANKFTNADLAKHQQLAACLRQNDDPNLARQLQLKLGIDDLVAATIYARIGKEKQHQSQLNSALKLYRSALELNQDDLTTRQALGDVLCWQNKWAEAQIHYQYIIARRPHDSALALAYYGLGNTASNQNRPEEAFSAYTQSIHLDSRLAKVYIDWGITLYHQGKFEEAIEKLKMSIYIDNNDPRAYHFLGIVLTAQGKNKEANLEFERAIELWQKTIGANPHDSSAYGLLANILSSQSKFSEAEAAARQAILLNLYNADAHNALGNVLMGQQKIPAAIEAYRNAINYHPYLVVIQTNLGYALFLNDNLDEALVTYQYALKLNPYLFYTHRFLGDLLLAQGKFTEAIKAYRESIRINHYDFTALYQLASVLRLSGHHAEANTENQIAIATCEQLLVNNPRDIAANYGLAQALHFDGRLMEAINAYLRIIDINKNTPFIHGSLGFALLQNGNLDRARQEFELATSQNPLDAMAFYGLGEVLVAQNQIEQAIVKYNQAIKINSKLPQVYVALGHISYNRSELKQASEYYQRAIAINPREAWYYHHLGVVLEKQGYLDLAIEKINQAISLNSKEAIFLNDIANIYSKKSDFYKAIFYYQMAISKQPNQSIFYHNLGCLLAQNGYLTGAMFESRMAVRLSRSQQFIDTLARILNEDRNLDDLQKIPIYQEISIYDPQNPTWHNLIGNLWFGKEQWAEAANAYQQAISINPQESIFWYNLSLTRGYQQNWSGAKQAISKAIELNPNYADAREYSGRIDLTLGDTPAAVDSLTIAKYLFAQRGLTDRVNNIDLILTEISKQKGSSELIKDFLKIFNISL